MNARIGLALLLSPLAVLVLVAAFPLSLPGTAWALLLLASIILSGYALARR